jgi:hypothetical protein
MTLDNLLAKASRKDDWPLKDVDSATQRKPLEDAPPSYSDVPSSSQPPDIVAAFAQLDLDRKERKPTADHCIAHLKLLEAIHQLREDVGGTDGLYGIFDRFAEHKAEGSERQKILTKIKEKRWAIFVILAARRFEKWFQTIEPEALMLTLSVMEQSAYSTHEKSKRPLLFTVDNMPPLGMSIMIHKT